MNTDMNANTGNKVVFKKPKKNIRVKSFRLLDFHTFDDRKTKTESSSDDDYLSIYDSDVCSQ